MTDQELSTFGERLYTAIISARLSQPALQDLAENIEAQKPWDVLGDRTKIAVFLVAARMALGEEDNGDDAGAEPGAGAPPVIVEEPTEDTDLASVAADLVRDDPTLAEPSDGDSDDEDHDGPKRSNAPAAESAEESAT
jgi:hypothetical protein